MYLFQIFLVLTFWFFSKSLWVDRLMLDFIISQSLCFFFPYPVYLIFLSFCLSKVKKSMIIIRAIKKRIRIILSVAVIISSACLIVTIFFITILNSQSLYENGFSKQLSSFVKKISKLSFTRRRIFNQASSI